VDTITLGTKNDTEQFVSIKIYPQAKEDPKIKVRHSPE
jgi:glycine betaine/choline ABC-type transport system substrate-binding protein